jgi:hypothetical protein
LQIYAQNIGIVIMKAFCLIELARVGFCEEPEPELNPYGAILRSFIAITPCSSDVQFMDENGKITSAPLDKLAPFMPNEIQKKWALPALWWKMINSG